MILNDPDNPGRFMLNPVRHEITDGISLITAVKNRQKLLSEALTTWVTHGQIDEIIIVDWDSDESLVPMIKGFNDDRIVLVRAKKQERWIQTKAFNLGARFSSRNKIMKIDGDIRIHKGFFEQHPLEKGVFYTGNWALGRNPNETHLNGTVLLYRDDFFAVNGYNELLKLYGYDDTDLYDRLAISGLHRLDFNNNYLHHIEHESRVSATELSEYLDKLTDAQKADISILMNRYLLTQSYSWNAENSMLEMEVAQVAPNIFECNQLCQAEPDIPGEVLRKSLNVAIQDRLHLAGYKFSDRLFETGTRNEMIDLYFLFHQKNGNQFFENLFNLIHKFDQSVSNSMLIIEGEIKSLKETNLTQRENLTEVTNRIDSIYLSYSWKAGHFFFSMVSGILRFFRFNTSRKKQE